MAPIYSLVVPIFNEEAVLPVLLHRLDALLARLDGPAEVIFVDDGSRDTSPIVLEAKEIGWGASSRNFGQVVPYFKHDQDHVRHEQHLQQFCVVHLIPHRPAPPTSL